MTQYTIALFVGSFRKESWNKKLAQALTRLAPEDFAFDPVCVDDLPLYNQDDDDNQAPPVKRVKEQIRAADGLLFVTPEYNRSVPGVLKNAIDHASRPYGQSAFTGKPAGVIGASIGAAVKLPGDAWLGLGYVALPGAFGQLTLSGRVDVVHAPREGGMTENATAEVSFRMAQMLFIGYRRPLFGSLDLVTDVRWQDLSRHNQFDIRLIGSDLTTTVPEWMPRYRGMQDVWRASAGIERRGRRAR